MGKGKTSQPKPKPHNWGAKAVKTDVPQIVVTDDFHLEVELKKENALSKRALKYVLLVVLLLVLAIGILLMTHTPSGG